MPLLADDSLPPQPKRSISCPQAIITSIYLLFTDIVLYGFAVPLIGAYIGECLGRGLSTKWELVTVVMATFILMYSIFCLIGETSYWKHLFAFNGLYNVILHIRDGVNFGILLLCVLCIASTVEVMVDPDQGIKSGYSGYVSEGMIGDFLHWFCLKVMSLLARIRNMDPLNEITVDEIGKNDHRAAFMIFWAMLTASVAKLLYFNTLYTYLRAIDIFIAMKPSFLTADDYDDDAASVTFRSIRN